MLPERFCILHSLRLLPVHSQVLECDQKYSQVTPSLFVILMSSLVYIQQFSATVRPKCIISNNIHSIDNANQSFDIMSKLKLLKMIISVTQVFVHTNVL